MAYVDKINVGGTDYDIRDKRIAGTEDVNVKPIYYHGIALQTGDYTTAFCGMMILDNDNTAYTAQRIKDWVYAIVQSTGSLFINVDGNVKNYEDESEVSQSFALTGIYTDSAQLAEDKIVVVGVDSTGSKVQFLTTLTKFFTYFTDVADRRNKIN